MGQLELSEGREFVDLLKSVSHAEALGIALYCDIGCWPYRYRREHPLSGLENLHRWSRYY